MRREQNGEKCQWADGGYEEEDDGCDCDTEDNGDDLQSSRKRWRADDHVGDCDDLVVVER